MIETKTISLDVEKIRKDFPIFANNPELVFLDNASTTQKPQSVIDTLNHYYENYNSNIHRGVHALSMEATDRHEEARQKCARFIGASSAEGLILVRNTTEAINLVANTWAKKNITNGDEILVTHMEHHSNLVPWQKVAQEQGATLRFIPLTEQHTLDLSNIDNFVTSKTKLIAFSMGEEAKFTRILCLHMGSPFTYVSLGKAVAPGQFSLDEIQSMS